MALQDLKLALMALPQSWSAGKLTFSIIAIPNGDPLNDPLIGSGPPFAGTTLNLDAVVVGGLDALPSSGALQQATIPLGLAAPATAKAMFQALAAAVKPGVSIGKSTLPTIARSIRKALPQSYLDARGPGDNAPGSATITEYGCALRPQKPQKPKPVTTTSWGEIISYALHQPVLASALGLRYAELASLTITPPADFFRAGGYLYVTLDTSDATNPYVVGWKANADVLKRYAARIPPLTATARPLFAPVLFPVDATATSGYDQVFVEADIYADGFAEIVHCFQPDSIDVTQTDPSRIPPAADAGLQIGWDDEQVMTWYRRQSNNAFLRATGQEASPEAPLAVTGYRVDVRTSGGPWLSLTNAQSALPLGLGSPVQELAIMPVASRPDSAAATESWLPLYFAQWRGGSLVTRDDIPRQLVSGKPSGAPSNVTPIVDPAAILQYGNDYEFRVRLADLSGGGPALADDDLDAPASGVGDWPFRRYLAPKAVRAATVVPTGTTIPTSFTVQRPLLGYPEALYTQRGATDQTAIAAYFSTQALLSPRPKQIGVCDPDVDRVQFTVEARTPSRDAPDPSLDNGDWRVLYVTERPLAALPAGLTDDDTPVTVALQFVDEAVAIGTAQPASGPLVLPTARDIRIRVRPLAVDRPDYYGPAASIGLVSDFTMRAPASDETALLAVTTGLEPTTAFLFRAPDETIGNDQLPDPVAAIAQTLELASDGLSLSARPGERVVFAASHNVRNVLDPAASSISFGALAELRQRWIVALALVIERDWTWDGLAAKGLTIESSVGGSLAPVGNLVLPPVLDAQAAADIVPPDPDKRNRTRIVFFDAIDSTMPASKTPAPMVVTWQVHPNLRDLESPAQTSATEDAIAAAATYTLTLPIARPPAQTVELRSAGIALTPYQPSQAYDSTSERDRSLWIELTEPIEPELALFARVLGNAPDPLLYDPPVELQQPVPQPLQVDPEFMRVITQASSNDLAGLDAMFRLVPATNSKLHYLLPLPPGVSADDFSLFGFTTYEFRTGHTLWSTAQARFGRPLKVAGIQQPAPPLRAVAGRRPDGSLAITAPYATPVFAGNPVRPREVAPKTTLCATLYAQALQANGTNRRNLLLAHAYGKPDQSWPEVQGLMSFDPKTIESRLVEYGLDARHTPLSVIVIEFMPRGGTGMATGRFHPGDNAVAQQNPDPAGAQFPTTRILRTSALTPVTAAC